MVFVSGNILNASELNAFSTTTIVTTGDVGIGTATPATRLHVDDSGTATIRINSTDSVGDSRIQFGNVDDTVQAAVFYDASLASLFLKGYNDTNRVRIASTGSFWVPGVYALTSAGAANVYAHSNGYLYRSTSSAKYKTDVEDLEDSYADRVLEMRPVWYRSTTGNDPTNFSYYGLIAEEVAAIDPRLVHFGPTPDCICPDDPENPDATAHTAECLTEPEGVQYDRLIPHLISVAKRQADELAALTARLEALESPA